MQFLLNCHDDITKGGSKLHYTQHLNKNNDIGITLYALSQLAE